MDPVILKQLFGPMPIEFLPAAQQALQASSRNKIMIVGAVIIVVATVVVTVMVMKKIQDKKMAEFKRLNLPEYSGSLYQ